MRRTVLALLTAVVFAAGFTTIVRPPPRRPAPSPAPRRSGSPGIITVTAQAFGFPDIGVVLERTNEGEVKWLSVFAL